MLGFLPEIELLLGFATEFRGIASEVLCVPVHQLLK